MANDLSAAVEAAPWCKDALFLVTFYGDAPSSILVRGWAALNEEFLDAHFHEPDDRDRESLSGLLTDWDRWENDYRGLPYYICFNYEDGDISATRVTEDRSGEPQSPAPSALETELLGALKYARRFLHDGVDMDFIEATIARAEGRQP